MIHCNEAQSAEVSDTPPARENVNTALMISLVVIHVFSLAAFLPCLFVWWGIPLVLIGNFIFGSLGINLGYHRMLSHKSVCFPRVLEKLWILCGVCCLEGSPLWWSCVHRIHHRHSDSTGDPHTPRNGFFWAHVQWIYCSHSNHIFDDFAPHVSDLFNDRFLLWLHRKQRWAKIYIAHGLIIFALGLFIGTFITDTPVATLRFGIQVFVWGVLVRTVYVWHVTWLVNSASHYWGYRNFNTPDRSRNNVLVAILTNGEGWHNNHHASPRTCSHSQRWWEMDLTFTAVRIFQLIGLAWDVVPSPEPNGLARRA